MFFLDKIRVIFPVTGFDCKVLLITACLYKLDREWWVVVFGSESENGWAWDSGWIDLNEELITVDAGRNVWVRFMKWQQYLAKFSIMRVLCHKLVLPSSPTISQKVITCPLITTWKHYLSGPEMLPFVALLLVSRWIYQSVQFLLPGPFSQCERWNGATKRRI